MTDDEADMLQGTMAIILLPRLIKREFGVLRYSTMKRFGVLNCHIDYLIRSGTLIRVAHGLYTTAGVEPWRRSPTAQVMAKQPNAVLALRTAAETWGLRPPSDEFWIGVPHKSHPSTYDFPVNWLYWSAPRLSELIDRVKFEGVPLRLTSPARTVADYFAHRKRLTAGEPEMLLKHFRQSELFDEAELLKAARLCRVTHLITTALKYG